MLTHNMFRFRSDYPYSRFGSGGLLNKEVFYTLKEVQVIIEKGAPSVQYRSTAQFTEMPTTQATLPATLRLAA